MDYQTRMRQEADQMNARALLLEILDPTGTVTVAVACTDPPLGLASHIWATDPDKPQVEVRIPVGDPHSPFRVRITASGSQRHE